MPRAVCKVQGNKSKVSAECRVLKIINVKRHGKVQGARCKVEVRRCNV